MAVTADHATVEAAGDEQDADWYFEWFVQDGDIRARGWTPLMGVGHDGLTEWEHNCKAAIEADIEPDEHEADVVFRSWAYRNETGVYWEALADGIGEPEVPRGGGE